jgi:hypothetical protein
MSVLQAQVSLAHAADGLYNADEDRKIRCCGGAPCRNCTRASRECEYTPVPEEVNRATREKKANARATKAASMSSFAGYSPMAYTPYMQAPTFDMQYASPSPSPVRPMPHRRTLSNPSPSLYVTPPAPMLNSPAMLESSTWMYNSYTPNPYTPNIYTPSKPYPSVFTPALDYSHSPVTPAYPTMQSEVPLAGLGISTPALTTSNYAAPPLMYTPASSSSSLSETPPHTPATYAPPPYFSETLAPPLQLKPQMQPAPLVGLGIGMPSEPYGYVPGSYFSAV